MAVTHILNKGLTLGRDMEHHLQHQPLLLRHQPQQLPQHQPQVMVTMEIILKLMAAMVAMVMAQRKVHTVGHIVQPVTVQQEVLVHMEVVVAMLVTMIRLVTIVAKLLMEVKDRQQHHQLNRIRQPPQHNQPQHQQLHHLSQHMGHSPVMGHTAVTVM